MSIGKGPVIQKWLMAALHSNSTKKMSYGKFDSMIDLLRSGGVWAVPENGLHTGSTFGSECLPV